MRRAYKRQSRWIRRTIDYAIYVSVGVVFWLCTLALAQSTTTARVETVVKWIGLAVNTSIIFGYGIHAVPRRARTKLIWAAWCALLLLHLLAFSYVLVQVDDWRPGNFLVITPIEFVAVAFVLSWVIDAENSAKRPNS